MTRALAWLRAHMGAARDGGYWGGVYLRALDFLRRKP